MTETVAAMSEQPRGVDLSLPPPHPRVAQLIQLERAKFERIKELRAIEAECEAAATPIALEIERLEGDEAKFDAGSRLRGDRRGELSRLAEQHGELISRIMAEREAQDARLKAEADRISAEVAELDTADGSTGAGRRAVDTALADARERFNAARTTPRGRAIERKVREISQQQEKIVARNPGARFFRLEMNVNHEAERLGLRAKVKAVVEAIGSPTFMEAIEGGVRQLREELQAEPSAYEVRRRVLRILAEMQVPADDAAIEVVHGRRHGFSIKVLGLSDEARGRCLAAIAGAEDQRPVQAEGAAEATAA